LTMKALPGACKHAHSGPQFQGDVKWEEYSKFGFARNHVLLSC
jgi:hypothetical protein